MKCPFCGHNEDKVIDSRSSEEGRSIRRRRECLNCQRRFTTYENIEEAKLVVMKKDGRREPFDRKKILSGLTKACEKRPISTEQLEALADKIEYTHQVAKLKSGSKQKNGDVVLSKPVRKNKRRVASSYTPGISAMTKDRYPLYGTTPNEGTIVVKG